tara:strand:+ start:999 stop:3605 length:2607 start_codon:yes stop_codon:yes gene_type:complete
MSALTDGLRAAGPSPSAPMPNAKKISDPVIISGLLDEEISKEDWLSDPTMAARAALDGYFWGWPSEIGSAVAAGLYKGLSLEPEPTAQFPERFQEMTPEQLVNAGFENGQLPQPASDKSYTDIRRDMLNTLEEEQDIWTADNPALSFGLNIGGSLFSGGAIYSGVKNTINAVPAALAAVPALRPAIQGLQQAKVTKSLAALEAAPAPATALAASIAATPTARTALSKAVPELPALAATGAIASMGFANQDEDLGKAAATGAVLSAVLGYPLTATLNYAANGVARQKIAQQLGKGKDFIPIGMATLRDATTKFERTLNWGYNKIVNKAFGSDSLVAQQQKRWTQVADRELAASQKAFDTAKQDVKAKLANVTEQQQLNVSAAKLEVSNAELLSKQASTELKKETIENIKQKAVLDYDASVNALEASFRLEATKAATPSSIPAKVLKEINEAPDQHSTVEALQNAWTKYGFRMLKNKKFRINPEAIAVQVRQAVGIDEDFLAAMAGTPVVKAKELISEYIGKYTTTGQWIQGETLNNLRTTIATAANARSTTGESAAGAIILKELVKVLDDTVVPQLSKVDKKAFYQQKEAWKSKIALDEAVLASLTKGGSFTPEQYIATLRGLNRNAAKIGKSPLQKQALEVIKIKGERDTVIKRAAVTKEKQVRGDAQAAANKALFKAQAAVIQIEKAAKSKVSSAAEQAENPKLLEQARLNLEGHKSIVEGFKNIEARPNAPIWEKIPATLMLSAGNPATWLTGGAASIVVGASTGRGVASQSFQRAIVGQTEWQQALNKILQTGKPVERAVTAGRVASASVPADPLDPVVVKSLLNSPKAKKLQAFDKLSRAGRLENMQYTNPKVYKALTEANANR